jgi:hypothetical protein
MLNYGRGFTDTGLKNMELDEFLAHAHDLKAKMDAEAEAQRKAMRG